MFPSSGIHIPMVKYCLFSSGMNFCGINQKAHAETMSRTNIHAVTVYFFLIMNISDLRKKSYILPLNSSCFNSSGRGRRTNS